MCTADESDASNAISESDAHEDSLWKRMQRTAREAGWENTDGDPKIALLFLTRGPIPHDHLWERFISENPSLVSVYIHPAPGFKYNSTTTRAPSFYDRQVALWIALLIPLIDSECASSFVFRSQARLSSGEMQASSTLSDVYWQPHYQIATMSVLYCSARAAFQSVT